MDLEALHRDCSYSISETSSVSQLDSWSTESQTAKLLARHHTEGQEQGKEPSPGPCLHNSIIKPPFILMAASNHDKSLLAE